MLRGTRYARSGDVHIAYQVVGEGPRELVVIPGFVSNLDVLWEVPGIGDLLKRLSRFARLIVFDKRGTGLSDRGVGIPDLEQRMDDARAVMDAAGSRRAAFLGISEGGPMSILFAATYPERVRSLTLLGSFSRFAVGPDYPYGLSEELQRLAIESVERAWGTGSNVRMFCPSEADSPGYQETWARLERLSASPRDAQDLIRMDIGIDVRDVLPSIHVPCMILHADGDRVVNVAGARYMAERIPGARLRVIPCGDHTPTRATAAVYGDLIEEFLTGQRAAPSEPDRVLATVLFTDIVDSTARAVELGDRRWSELLHHHHGRVRDELRRFRGKEMDTAGDGFFATFDGPARAVRCARSIVDSVGDLRIQVRAGLHTGECELHGDKMTGIAVHIGSRVAGLAKGGEVLVSSTVKDLVAGSGIEFADRGAQVLKGVPGEWRIFRVTAAA